MRMRRLVTVACLALGLALAHAGSASAGSGKSFHFTISGRGLEGFVSTFPADGSIVAGTTYRDTYLVFADQAVRDSGETYADKFAFVDSYAYTFDRKGNFVFLGETFGWAGGNDVALTVGKQLGSGSGSATMLLTTCVPSRRDITCSDATGSVSGSWSGSGDLYRVNDTTHFHGGGTNETSRFRGAYRYASVSASLNGSDLGASSGGDIFDFTSADVSVWH